jgi:hypothetical protein
VYGYSEDIMYAFVGVTEILTHEEVIDCIGAVGVDAAHAEDAIKMLLWYGALGIASRDNERRFIYDYEYDYKRLFAELRSVGDDKLYVVNPALYVALSS